jgi:hypothetical protein
VAEAAARPISGGGGDMAALEGGVALPMVTFHSPVEPYRRRRSPSRERRQAARLAAAMRDDSWDDSFSSVDLHSSGASSPVLETSV